MNDSHRLLMLACEIIRKAGLEDYVPLQTRNEFRRLINSADGSTPPAFQQSSRTVADIAENPLNGDVVEIYEPYLSPGDAEPVEVSRMLRVIAVHEPFIWFKQYGTGNRICHLPEWKKRFSAASKVEVVQYGNAIANQGGNPNVSSLPQAE